VAVLDVHHSFERSRPCYTVKVVSRGGEVSRAEEHCPWSAVFTKGRVPTPRKGARVVEVEELGRVPMLYNGSRFAPAYDYTSYRVSVSRASEVPVAARFAIRAGARAGAYNIKYPYRAAADLGARVIHDRAPLSHNPRSELEGLLREVLDGVVPRIRVLACGLAVYNEGGFPQPGSPVLAAGVVSFELGDPSVFDRGWWRDNIDVIEAATASEDESEVLAGELAKRIESTRPDIVVGYRSIDFDAEMLKPFHRGFGGEHIELGGLVFPHLDLSMVRENFGPALGIRSASAYSLDDVVMEVKDKRISWLAGSELMEAEKAMDPQRIYEEYSKRSELFYRYLSADVYITAVLAAEWLPTLLLVSALTSTPVSLLNSITPGLVSEYNAVLWLESLGFEPEVTSRKLDMAKVVDFGDFAPLLPEELKRLFSSGKVYSAGYGVYRGVAEFDFSQLYPSIMAAEAVDPTSIYIERVLSPSDASASSHSADPLVVAGHPVTSRSFPVVLGHYRSKNAQGIVADRVAYVFTSYGPISLLVSRLYAVRKFTKKLKEEAGRTGRGELAAADQAVKILANSAYGALGRERGFVNEYAAAYIFWRSAYIFRRALEFVESLGYRVVYGDTDSLFVLAGFEDAERIASELNRFVKQEFGEEFSVEFKGYYDECLFPKAKYEDAASKKSYLCLQGGRVAVVKGDLFKLEAPDAVKDRVREFYEELLRRGCTDRDCIAELVRSALEAAGVADAFATKKVSFVEEGSVKRINKAFHYAACAHLYASSHPSVRATKRPVLTPGAGDRVVFTVDPEEAPSVIVVKYMPGQKPSDFTLLLRASENEALVMRGSVVPEDTKSNKYTLRMSYTVQRMTKEEVVKAAMAAFDKYLIQTLANKLAAPLSAKQSKLYDWEQ